MNKGLICVSVCAGSADEMIEKIRRAEEFADVIEVRFDSLNPGEIDFAWGCPPLAIEKIIESTTKPIISTFRPKDQGGYRELSISERRSFWNSGIETALCDVEKEFVEDTLVWLWEERICSFHDFAGVPKNIDVIFGDLAQQLTDIVKMAVQADDAVEAASIWKLFELAQNYKRNPVKVIPIAMGEAGKWTRILGLAHGAFLTYASLGDGDETAPGQVTAKDLRDVYRAKDLDLETRVYGVIGDPVEQSPSPYMHNAAFADIGINAVYLPFQVKDLEMFMRRMVAKATREIDLNFAGFSVTIPHKIAILPFLDEIDPVAVKVGAVNTVRIEDDGSLTGYNTDADGFIRPLRKLAGDVRGARVAIFGAGGASRACIYALKEAGAEVTVIARDAAKGAALADEFKVGTCDLSKIKAQRSKLSLDFNILVNTTPLGMKGRSHNASPFTADQLDGLDLVYDLVTSETPLLREARAANVRVLDGLEMLIEQGAKQFEIWTGREAPIDVMRASLAERMQK